MENEFELWLKTQDQEYQIKKQKIEKIKNIYEFVGIFIGFWLRPTTIPITLYILQQIF